MKIKYCIYIIITIFVLSSCDGQCKIEEIKKYEWITCYVKYNLDTMLAYKIMENKTEYIAVDKEIAQKIALKNENHKFSNYFSVVLNYDYFDTDIRLIITKSDTLMKEIKPDSIVTFEFKRQCNYFCNFNSTIEVLEFKKHVTDIKRIDSLKIGFIFVNSCEKNIEAIKEGNEVVKRLFESKWINSDIKY